MAQQQQTRASPAPVGFSIAHRVMDDAVEFYLVNGGPAVARPHIENLAKELIIYDDCAEAYRQALAKISAAELAEQLKAEKNSQQQQRNWLMAMMGIASQTTAAPAAPTERAPLQAKDLSEEHIRRSLERLMDEMYDSEEKLFNQKSHWQAVFRVLSDAGMFGGDDFDFFDGLMKRVMPREVNAPYSRTSVKNISQTLFNKPFARWQYDPGLMKRREPYDRMVLIVERFTKLLNTP